MIEKPSTTGGALGNSPDEAALLAAFRAMSDGYRANAILVMQSLARSFPRQRPTLTLVHGGGDIERKGDSP